MVLENGVYLTSMNANCLQTIWSIVQATTPSTIYFLISSVAYLVSMICYQRLFEVLCNSSLMQSQRYRHWIMNSNCHHILWLKINLFKTPGFIYGRFLLQGGLRGIWCLHSFWQLCESISFPDTSVFHHDRISKRRVYLRNFAIVSRVLQVCNLTV